MQPGMYTYTIVQAPLHISLPSATLLSGQKRLAAALTARIVLCLQWKANLNAVKGYKLGLHSTADASPAGAAENKKCLIPVSCLIQIFHDTHCA